MEIRHKRRFVAIFGNTILVHLEVWELNWLLLSRLRGQFTLHTYYNKWIAVGGSLELNFVANKQTLCRRNGGFVNDFVNSCAGFVVNNKNELVIMAKMEVTPRRSIPEDKVYRQIFDAEVIFQLFLDLFITVISCLCKMSSGPDEYPLIFIHLEKVATAAPQ